jgi:putative endonuclease
MFWVYILKSKKDNRNYTGHTNDLIRRIGFHNHGLVKATNSRRPLTLIYKEVFKTRKEAITREKFLKTHKGYNYLKKLGLH